MRVLVTGGTSLLGGAVAGLLRRRGDAVTVFQRRPGGVAGCREVLGDVQDPTAVQRAVDGQHAVVHLAARVSVTGTWEAFRRTNIEGTANVVVAARQAGVRRFVQVSSPSVAHGGRALVGAGAGPADPRRARGHYARSKARAEQLVLAADSPAFGVVAVRPHLVWGPGDTQLVGRIVARARARRLALIGQGAALIDSTYLDDAADALIAALDRAEDIHGRALVITGGEPRPVAELLAGICAAAGAPPPSLRVPYPLAYAGGAVAEAIWAMRPGSDEPPMTRFLAEQLATAHWFDQRVTRRLLGWEPQVGIDEGLVRLAAAFGVDATA
jgi:nucleoside-diphosphate-sugar epimerase